MNGTNGRQSLALVGVAVVGVTLMFLSGCAAFGIILTTPLKVESRMGETIFLEPSAPDKKVIYVEVRNTSDRDNFDLEKPIKAALKKRGYRVTENPHEAHYRLQANVLQVSETDQTAVDAALDKGFGGPPWPPGLDAAAGGWGGYIRRVTEFVTGLFVKKVMFMVVTDIQLVDTKNKQYRTRVVSTATKANLEYKDAAQDLTNGLTSALSGLF